MARECVASMAGEQDTKDRAEEVQGSGKEASKGWEGFSSMQTLSSWDTVPAPPHTRTHGAAPPSEGGEETAPSPSSPLSCCLSQASAGRDSAAPCANVHKGLGSLGQGLSSLWLLTHSKMGQNSAFSVVSGIKPRNSHVCAWQVFCYIAQP